MSPLPYQPELPPGVTHRVKDREGVEWSARFDGLCLRAGDYDWRVRFTHPAAESVAYVEPGTSLDHEAFLRDLLADAEPERPTEPIESGRLHDFLEETIADRVAWTLAAKTGDRVVAVLDPDDAKLTIEFAERVFPTHRDTLGRVVEQAIEEAGAG